MLSSAGHKNTLVHLDDLQWQHRPHTAGAGAGDDNGVADPDTARQLWERSLDLLRSLAIEG